MTTVLRRRWMRRGRWIIGWSRRWASPQSDVPLPKDGFALKDLLQDIEVNMIRKALDSTRWNVSSAAKLLDMHRTTLIQKISKLDIAQDNLPVNN